jgi:hypothetical protein
MSIEVLMSVSAKGQVAPITAIAIVDGMTLFAAAKGDG